MHLLRTMGLAVLGGLLVLSGCQKAPPKGEPRDYDIKGKVVAVAADKSRVTIDHEDIPGYMSAMKMEFPVSDPKVLEGIAAGDLVRGRLIVSSDNQPAITWMTKVDALGTGDKDADYQEVRAKLAPEERKLVDAQDLCPVQTDSKLGSMGKPYKVTIKGQAVFLCCKSCEKKALANPEKTLARVEELKEKRK